MMTTRSPATLSPTVVLFTTASLCFAVSYGLTSTYKHVQRKLQELHVELQRMEELRQEERTGRIRAELKLRTLSKQQHNNNGSDKANERVFKIIGNVVSPYTKRMGTPRQPQLVPSSRGYIEFNIPASCLEGIEEYSHVWVLFEFHANTNITNQKTKIRPPRGSGQKVGQLASRSPHRPNPIGLSLVTLERWDVPERRLYISGLDLVNGSPVFDIKPCVPWDVPGYFQKDYEGLQQVLKVPSWVSQEDEIAQVEFSRDACSQLHDLIMEGKLAPLYTKDNDGYVAATQTLQEVLAQDPRSSHKGVNGRGSESASMYSLLFCSCQVEFTVSYTKLKVRRISAVDLDSAIFVDGIPLIASSVAIDTPEV